ncbi:50S ribosomal protein L13 [Candidatus Uhrbacteria bacterium]|nr:50S ribosomal protein L13 [Candidatus Uhrbacteria bacterium]
MQRIKQIRATHEIDAEGKVLGRLATRIATILRGKHKATFQPHIDGGDIVIVRNAGKVKLTGQKMGQKVYHHHTGYPGGLRTKKLSTSFGENPAWVVHHAVYQMLPDNRLRKEMIKRLHISND